MIIVELGPGKKKRVDNAIGVDIIEGDGVDIVADLNYGLPFFNDSSIDEIYSHHVLEHLSSLSDFMREVHRVLKPGGKFRGEVPHFSNPYFYSDPTHKINFGLYTFNYFVKDQSQFKRNVPGFYNNLNFDFIEYNLIFKNPICKNYLANYLNILYYKLFNSSVHMQEKYELYFSRIISCYELRFLIMKAI